MNGVTVIADLDIYARVGKAVAHDELVPFVVQGHQLSVGDNVIDFDGTLTIQFAKASTSHTHTHTLYGPPTHPPPPPPPIPLGPSRQPQDKRYCCFERSIPTDW